MEISPFPGIRVQPVARVQPLDPGLHAIFDIEAAVRPGDDTFSRNRRKAAEAEEPEDEDALKEEAQASGGEEINSRPAPEPPSNLISLFA